jgi:6-pyruvoyltetrahydropterin/6-carboxytetrahydropterin synthase
MKSKIKCIRKLHFCAGHRVLNHEGKCATPHGHNYNAHIYAEADQLDDLGMVIDFSVLKEKVGAWIETHWDHNFLVFEEDLALIQALKGVGGKKTTFICPFNPTAENLAHYLLHKICPEQLQGTNVQVTKVVLYESENCYVEAEIQ